MARKQQITALLQHPPVTSDVSASQLQRILNNNATLLASLPYISQYLSELHLGALAVIRMCAIGIVKNHFRLLGECCLYCRVRKVIISLT
ncbi:hypothetical protein INT80_06850 [Gallibacterium anatis]|uniref:Uncharacterized protein n=1 Tax=Gallibacterium anatis TaxID=750 RepID=A0A930Y533_9PAST|nr:hypothetical protein [Gallibacterium anatis]